MILPEDKDIDKALYLKITCTAEKGNEHGALALCS